MQTFTQTYSNSDMDASLLLMVEYGFIEADDLRYKKTVKAVKDTLFDNGLMHRYINTDDFGKPSKLLGNFPQAYSHLALINTATLFSQERFVSKFIKP